MKRAILAATLILWMIPAIVAAQIRVSVTTDKFGYAPGERVIMTLTATNVSRTTDTLIFPTSQQYDFVVYYRGGVIWRWSDGKAFVHAFTSVILKPGESFVSTTDEYIVGTERGFYRLVGIIPVYQQREYSGTTIFSVR